MRQKPTIQVGSSEQVVKDIRWATRKQYSAEEKIRIVLNVVQISQDNHVEHLDRLQIKTDLLPNSASP